LGTRLLRLVARSGRLVAVLCLTIAAAAHAETITVRSKQLSVESLDCLRKGEEAIELEVKLAAYRRGVDLARQAIEVDEANADAHFALFANEGRLMVHQGIVPNPMSLMRATRELNRTLELDPNHADALAAKGGMYRQLPWMLGGSKEKAREYLLRSVENDFDNACGARIELAELYRDLGEPERSIPLLQQAAEIAKRDAKPDKLARAQQLLRELGR
jgi:tetratricopeptide (TPR) repeat protein